MANRKKKPGKAGTERWHPETVAEGQFILLPKALIKGTGKLGLKPHHVWFLLAVQLEQYGQHPARHYWDELAAWAGVKKSTVRRWASELKEKGLLRVVHRHGPREGEERRPGFRNDRNEFHLKLAEDAVLKVHRKLQADKEARRKRKAES